jgi:hypothetical protein
MRASKLLIIALCAMSMVNSQMSIVKADDFVPAMETVPNNTSTSYTLDSGDSGGDITLQFGAALAESLKWNSANARFDLSDDLNLTGGITTSGGSNSLNNNSNFATNINTGTSTGAVAIGGGSNTVDINSTSWEISSAGLISGLTGLTSTGNITLTGANITGASPLVFDGLTENANKTTLAITDPTDARIITVPDISGTLVTTGDTGTITSTMILDDTLTASDLAATLTFTDGDLMDLSAINESGTSEGLRLPQATDVSAGTSEGQIGWDSDDNLLQIGTNGGIKTIGGYNNIQSFTASGTWTKPAGVSTVYVQVWGGGGGGQNGANNQGGGGGGGGGYSAGLVDVTGDVTVTVGNGGTAGVAGGLSRFAGATTITGNGGGTGNGGTGGTGTGGTINLSGATGAPGEGNDGGGGGGGGGSPFGGAGGGGGAGANAANPSTAGGAGTRPGGGGGGGSENAGAGGTGGAGLVIVYY